MKTRSGRSIPYHKRTTQRKVDQILKEASLRTKEKTKLERHHARLAKFTSSEENGRKNKNLDDDLNEIYTRIKSTPNYCTKISDFLRRNVVSSLFAPVVKRNFKRRRIIAHYPYEYIMSDLIQYSGAGLKHANRGYTYICIVIDVFGKIAYGEAMKNKDALSTTIALEKILSSMPSVPAHLITDEGLEYYNNNVDALLKRYGIHHYSIKSKKKACVAERFIRTLKSRLEKYFYDKNTKDWLSVYKQFIENYNNTPHSSIKMSPNEVNENNRAEVFNNLYPNIVSRKKPRLAIGDQVRLIRNKSLFEKGYTRNWSKEIYKINKVFMEANVDYYQIVDNQGNILSNNRYYYELRLVSRK